MEGGSFRSAQDEGYVRATAMMNSKSSNDIGWSVRLTDNKWICLGIASNELIQNEQPGHIIDNDKRECLSVVISLDVRQCFAGDKKEKITAGRLFRLVSGV